MSAIKEETLDLFSCQIQFGKGTLSNITKILEGHLSAGKRYFLLSDENTHNHCLPVVRKFLPGDFQEFIIPPGEKNKSLGTAEKAWKWLVDHKAGREDLLVNLGGGVVSDLGGFIASTYKRGIPYMNIPTSLIGMVDAAIGGKTAVNLSSAKNQVGSFFHPRAVIIDPHFLVTLPHDHVRSGYAEILKMGLLTGEELWKMVKSESWEEIDDWLPLIIRSVREKSMVVSQDPEDRDNRKILNFGHTLGHAFEAGSLNKYPPGILHGDAVASGIIGELFISWQKGHFCWDDLIEISTFLKRTFPQLPFQTKDKPYLFDIMMKDKKARGGTIRIYTMKKIGEPLRDLSCDEETISKAIDFVLNDTRV